MAALRIPSSSCCSSPKFLLHSRGSSSSSSLLMLLRSLCSSSHRNNYSSCCGPPRTYQLHLRASNQSPVSNPIFRTGSVLRRCVSSCTIYRHLILCRPMELFHCQFVEFFRGFALFELVAMIERESRVWFSGGTR